MSIVSVFILFVYTLLSVIKFLTIERLFLDLFPHSTATVAREHAVIATLLLLVRNQRTEKLVQADSKMSPVKNIIAEKISCVTVMGIDFSNIQMTQKLYVSFGDFQRIHS